jgi:hydrogenase expression/formation protein HypC
MKMCLAIPAKIVSIKESIACVDFGEGVTRDVNVTLVDVKVGDYVLVHAGYAIQVLDKTEARETIKLWNQVFETETQNSKK